jgi:hypothetical protein
MFRKYLFLILNLILGAYSPCLFSQNQKIDGYKGIWFSSGEFSEYGYKYSGGVSTFASRHRPIAIYSPEARKTFFVYGGTTSQDERHLLIMISYYDHKSHSVPRPVIVYDKMGVREPSDNASLSIDKNGYLWVFVSGSGRTRAGLIFKSSKPYSIENFELVKEMEMISPQPWWISGSGFMLMYSKVLKGLDICFSSSSDGKTWTESYQIAAMGGHLQVSDTHRNRLVTAFNYFPGGSVDRQTNLYLLQTEDMGKTWKTIDGKLVETPLTMVINDALIKNYEIEGKLVHLSDIGFDRDGNPVLLVILSKDINPGPKGDPREWMIISRRNQEWNFTKVCESTHNFDRGSLIISNGEWRIIGPTEPGPRKYGTGGEIALWVSRNEGIGWVKELNVTSASKNNNSFVRHPVNAQKDFYALWTDGNTDEFSISYLYFTNEKCDKVWMLPYEMKEEFQKPVRIK